MTIRTRLVETALTCATNEGRFYPRFVEAALKGCSVRHRTCAMVHADQSLSNIWTSLVRAYLPTFYRAGDMEDQPPFTIAEQLALAAALCDHYATHISEWTENEIRAACRQYNVLTY